MVQHNESAPVSSHNKNKQEKKTAEILMESGDGAYTGRLESFEQLILIDWLIDTSAVCSWKSSGDSYQWISVRHYHCLFAADWLQLFPMHLFTFTLY